MPNPKPSDTAGFGETLELLHIADAAMEEAFAFPFGVFEPQAPVRSDHQPRQSLPHVPEMLFNPSYVAASNLSRMYSDTDWQTAPEPDAAPLRSSVPPKAEPEAVAEELRLDACLTAEDLHRARRQFALANHPDRVDPWQREIATRRMTIANMLIDQALKQKAGKGK